MTKTLVCVLLSLAWGCGGNPAPVGSPDLIDRVIVPWAVPGDAWFCLEDPFLTICPMTVEQLRQWIASLRKAD